MRKAFGLFIHLAHAALLVGASMLDDARARRLVDADRVASGLALAPPDSAGGTRVPLGVIRCPMPLWRPDPNVRYALLVIGPGRVAGDHSDDSVPADGVSCVNPYARSAAYP